jgi:diguanylate cyclase (GGDEF)-like protein/PAS domain S-box-containing protein
MTKSGPSPTHATAPPLAFSTRLMAGCFLLICLIVLMGLWFTRSNNTQHRELAVIRVQNLAQVLERYVAGVAEKADIALKFVAFEYENQLARHRVDEKSIKRLIAQLRLQLPEVAEILVVNSDGNLWPNAGNVKDVNIADSEYFRTLRAAAGTQPVISGPLIDRTSKQWVVVVARRLNYSDGTFAGGIAAVIESNFFKREFAALDLGRLGAISLRTSSLTLVARHPDPPGAVSAIGTAAVSEELKNALGANPGSGSYVASTAIDGVERVNAYRRIAGLPFYVIVGTSTDAWRMAARRDAKDIAMLCGLAIALTIIFSWLLNVAWNRREHAISALAHESFRNNLLLRNASDGLHILDAGGNALEVNDSFCAMLGRPRAEVLGMNVAQWDAGLTGPALAKKLHTLRLNHGNNVFETRHRRRDGGIFDVEINATAVSYDDRDALFCSARDITARKAAEHALRVSENHLRLASNAGGVGLWNLDLVTGSVWRSLRHARIFGYVSSATPWSRDQFLEHVVAEDREFVGQQLNTVAENNRVQFECRILRTDRALRWIAVGGECLRDEHGAPASMTGTVMDITERKEAEAELKQLNETLQGLAVRDTVTGLFNRRYLDETVAREILEADRGHYSVGFIMMDIDLFKNINDTFGHPAGDKVLQALGNLLRENIRGADIACRYGGEEFLLVLPHAATPEAMQRAEQLRALVEDMQVSADGMSVSITMSAGVATYPADGKTGDTVIARSDTALYAAKMAGRNCVRAAGHNQASSTTAIHQA